MAVETNVDISMPDEYSSKYLRIQSEEIDRDLGSRKQICEFPINKQDEIRRVYFKKCPYQLKNINYSYSNDTHRHRFQPSNWSPHVQIPGYTLVVKSMCICTDTIKYNYPNHNYMFQIILIIFF